MKSTLTFDEQPATFFILQTSETKFLPLSLSLSIFEKVQGEGELFNLR